MSRSPFWNTSSDPRLLIKMAYSQFRYAPVDGLAPLESGIFAGTAVVKFVSHEHTGPVLDWAHNDVIKWKHYPRYWPFVRGIHRLPINSPHKRQWRGALMVSLICAWISSWVNSREAGDFRRQRAHYDANVMSDGYQISVGHAFALWPHIAWIHKSMKSFVDDLRPLLLQLFNRYYSMDV